MEHHPCGKCTEVVSGIEPVVCGMCETYYHIGRECSGITRTEMNTLTKCTALWLCPGCRIIFGNKPIHELLKNLTLFADMQAKIADLASTVNELSGKIEKKQCFVPIQCAQLRGKHSTNSRDERETRKTTSWRGW